MQVTQPEWPESAHVVLAVSTGVDSMVLLHKLLHVWRDRYRVLTCLHVNHGIREASEAEATFLSRYCAEYGVTLYTHRLNLDEIVSRGNSIQHVARQARYAWFDDMMRTLSGDVLLTAHHEDDQIETIFYRLMTGKVTRSRLGISETEVRGTYTLVRPLLHVSKADIRQYQIEHDVPYYEDASNADNRYVRNDIRNRLLPEIAQNPHLDPQQLLKLKAWHDDTMSIMETQATTFIQTMHQEGTKPNEWAVLPRRALCDLPRAMRNQVLDKWFQHCGVDIHMSERAYDMWFQQMDTDIAQCTLYTADKWIIQIAYDKLVIMANHTITRWHAMTIKHAGTYTFNGYDIVIDTTMPTEAFPLQVRTRQPGDRVALHHGVGHKKVSRLMIDHKIEDTERQAMPIVTTTDGMIIAVGLIYKHEQYKSQIYIDNYGR